MKTTALLTIAFAGFLCTVVNAQNTKNSNTSYPNDEQPYYYRDGVKYNQNTNTPLVFTGIHDPVNGTTPVEKAMDWVRQNQEVLGVKDLNDLTPYFERIGPSGSTIRLRQMYQGVPVYQGEIVVHISKKSEVTYVTNTFDPLIEGLNVVPSLTEEAALEIAKTHIAAKGHINFTSNDLFVYNREGNHLVHKVVIEGEAPLGSWEVIVDAHNGEVLRAADRACNHKGHEKGHPEEGEPPLVGPMPMPVPVNGTGNVFIPDPLSVAMVSYGTPYADNSDATNASLDATMSNVVLQDINFTGSQYQLVGPYAEVVDFESPYRGLFAQATSDFSFNRFDNAFEAVNCYYNIDLSMRYINETLGISLAPFQYSGGVQYDPSGLNGADNSHYLGGSGRVAFGEGGVDDAEDADVVQHELGHGLHDWLTGGNLSQVNGLSEGCGDYWATSYSRSLNQWTPADAEYNWMFNWDGHNPFWNGRITNYTASYPGGLTGAIHTDGQIWCSALMRIYDIIGRTKVDMAFLEGLAMTGSSTSQQDAAIAVRQAAIDLGYSCADVDVFTQEFTYTGYVLPALTPPSSTLNQTLCYGESVVVNGTTYDVNNPTGTEVIPGATAACDSTVTINLSFYSQSAGAVNTTICNNESIMVNGTVYDANNPSGTEVFAGAGSNGCDSTVTVNLNVLPASTGTVNTTLCDGGSIVVNGTTYDANNLSGTEVFVNGAANGCDSTVTVSLNVLPPLTGTVNGTLCSGSAMTINGTVYDENNPSGVEVFTNVGVAGCDSTVTINLSFATTVTYAINDPICAGESIVVNGTVYDANNPTGTEVFTNIGPFGCDSTVNINLTPIPVLTGTENSTICAGESIVVNGTTYDANNPTGTEVFTNVGPAGCDSTVTVNLNVLPAPVGSVNTTICTGESIVVNGTTYDANNPTGTEVFVNGGANGCDSTVTISLNVLPAPMGSENSTICSNESIVVNGTTYDANNPTGTEVIVNGGANGCDSTVTVNLNVLPTSMGSENSTICANESIVVNGTTYDANNPTGTEVILNGGANGCDSTVTVSLNVEAAIDASVTDNSPTLSANQSGASYQWLDCNNGNTAITGATSQDFTATVNGSYAVQITVGNCTETSACMTVANIGLMEQGASGIAIFPNPSQGIFSVEMQNNDAPVSFTVTSVDGKLVRPETVINTSGFKLDLSAESKGIYFLRLRYANDLHVFRLVLE